MLFAEYTQIIMTSIVHYFYICILFMIDVMPPPLPDYINIFLSAYKKGQ